VSKCIRIKCSQISANYKKPLSIDIGESFPLPPYSTVIGFVHNMCGFRPTKEKPYMPMKVSIQGEHATMISDMYTRYFMGIAYEEGGRHQLKVKNGDGWDGITVGPSDMELLIDVNLVLHILPQEQEDFDRILSGLKNPAIYPSLGRYEDLLRIDKVDVVKFEPTQSPKVCLDAYIPEVIYAKAKGLMGSYAPCSRYTLNKIYNINDKSGFREWEKVHAFHYRADNDLVLTAEVAHQEMNTEEKFGIFFA
jgi:CRISPR-associated protein Cas5t